MAVLKCKMCGGDLNVTETDAVIQCEYCGTRQTVPTADNEKKLNLFNRANRLRMASEFDKAAGIYENIIAEFPEEAEAYWGLCLCNYGIEYVDDPATARKIPTCHRASFEALQKDENFELALEYADVVAQKLYRDEAREIDRIMSEILSVSKNEKPYDVFICYKETDDKGQRTPDSVLAQDIYDALTAKGLKVFFSRITLEDKLGMQYEPYIFAALNSAKVMLSIGTKYEYFHAVWVKNEWSRFLKLMAKDKSKVLIPCFKDIDAYDMPDEFKGLQAQDLGKLGAVQDIVRGVEKILGKRVEKENKSNNTFLDKITPLIQRLYMFLDDGDFTSANNYIEKILDLNPMESEAYLARILVKNKMTSKECLFDIKEDLAANVNFERAMRYASGNRDEYLTYRNESMYRQGNLALEAAKTAEEVKDAKDIFSKIGGYKDVDEKISVCNKKIFSYADELLIKGKNSRDDSVVLQAKKFFDSIPEVAESAKRSEWCYKIYIDINSEKADNALLEAKTVSNYNHAIFLYKNAGKHADNVSLKVRLCEKEIEKIKLQESINNNKKKKKSGFDFLDFCIIVIPYLFAAVFGYFIYNIAELGNVDYFTAILSVALFAAMAFVNEEIDGLSDLVKYLFFPLIAVTIIKGFFHSFVFLFEFIGDIFFLSSENKKSSKESKMMIEKMNELDKEIVLLKNKLNIK